MKTLKRNVRWLLLGRFVVVSSLFIAAVVIQLATASFLPLAPFYLLILSEYVTGVVFLLLLLFDSHFRGQAYAQILIDFGVITGLVYISGGIGGQLYFLYVFAIIAAGLVLGGRAAMMTAAFSAIVFGALADSLAYGWIPYFRPDQAPETGIGLALYTVFTAWGLYIVIAVLVSRLSSSLRKTRAALDAAQMEINIRERDAAAGRASAIVAHEIRNPLAAISGAVQVLQGELSLNAEQTRLMDIVVKESRRVSQSIEQFLSLASPGKQTYAMFKLTESLAETLTMLRMSGELSDRVRVGGNYGSAEYAFFGSAGQFKQVFWNLIGNALKAMPDGGSLSIDFHRPKKNELSIRIVDTGRGMTAAEQARMFEPFYTRFDGGRGLGMAVVRQILESYAGKIQVQSEPHVGTDITITLPYREFNMVEKPGAAAGRP
ncbi:MAG: ATP-binding protein [Candidatus Aminicenantes bacterium]|nr:ATP-binding protein [Candidatus Aminicenantes bacterium]